MERKIQTALIVLLGLNTSFVVAHTASQAPDTYVQDAVASTTEDTSPHFGQSYRPVKNQTLWNISKNLVRNTEFSIQQGVNAIVAKNPQAFRNGNAHQIKKDVVLSLPTHEEMGMHSDANPKPKSQPIAARAERSEYDVYVNHAPLPSEEE
jgi:FimV-like protein